MTTEFSVCCKNEITKFLEHFCFHVFIFKNNWHNLLYDDLPSAQFTDFWYCFVFMHSSHQMWIFVIVDRVTLKSTMCSILVCHIDKKCVTHFLAMWQTNMKRTVAWRQDFVSSDSYTVSDGQRFRGICDTGNSQILITFLRPNFTFFKKTNFSRVKDSGKASVCEEILQFTSVLRGITE